MKLTMTELHFPRAPWRFNLSNLLEHYARGRRGASRPFAAACSSLWYPRPRVFVSQSVKKANTATPTHISYPAASPAPHRTTSTPWWRDGPRRSLYACSFRPNSELAF